MVKPLISMKSWAEARKEKKRKRKERRKKKALSQFGGATSSCADLEPVATYPDCQYFNILEINYNVSGLRAHLKYEIRSFKSG